MIKMMLLIISLLTILEPFIVDSYSQYCLDKPREISFVLDASSSIPRGEYEQTKSGIRRIVSHLPMDQLHTRVSFITFGDPKLIFNLDELESRQDLLQKLMRLRQMPDPKLLGPALMLQLQQVNPKMRPSAEKYLFVITAGDNTPVPLLKTVSENMIESGVIPISIGIGNKRNITELMTIAGDANHVFQYGNAREFGNDHETFINLMCPTGVVPVKPEPVKTTEEVTQTKESEETQSKLPLHPTRPPLPPSPPQQTSTKKIEIPELIITPKNVPESESTDKTTPELAVTTEAIKGCKNTKVDIIFCLDSSSSLSFKHWNKELVLTNKLIEPLNVDNKDARVGVIQYTDVVESNITLGTINNKGVLQDRLKSLGKMEGGTYIGAALAVAEKMFETHGRKGVHKTLILVTDGMDNSYPPAPEPQVVAERIKQKGIKILAIGVGSSIKEAELTNISSMESFSYIDSLDKMDLYDTTQLSLESCFVEKPIQPCSNKLDIVFLIDTSSQVQNTEWLDHIHFIMDLVGLFEFGEDGTKLSVIRFSDEAALVSDFSSNKLDILKSIESIEHNGGTTRIDKAFILARKTQYLKSREGVRKVVVLFSNGFSMKPAKSIGESYNLQELGISVVTVGVSTNSDKDELKLLASPKLHIHRSDIKLRKTLLISSLALVCEDFKFIKPKVCEANGDIVMMVDQSKDLDPNVWQGLQSTLLTMLRSFNISREKSRLGLVTYSTEANTEFGLDEYFNPRDSYVAIKRLKQKGNGGNLAQAMMRSKRLFKLAKRYNYGKVAIIFTDKMPEDQKLVLDNAKALKDDGINLIAVGLSKSSPYSFFKQMVDEKNIVKIDNINKVTKHKEQIREITCESFANRKDECTMKKLDVVVAMDRSTSIGGYNWKIQLDFLNRIVSDLDLRRERTRIGIFIFGTDVHLQLPINNTYNSQEIQGLVKNIPFSEGMTAIGSAIIESTEHLLQYGRKDVPKVMVIITDGTNSIGVEPQIPAVEAKRNKIKIISLGIGHQISKKELMDISSSGEYYKVKDYSDLEKYNAKSVTNDACLIPEKPKICHGAGDLIFIMGSGAKRGSKRFNQMSNFMKSLTKLTNIHKDYTRVAILKFNKGAYIDSGFKDTYEHFEKAIENMTSSTNGVYIGKALERARLLFNRDNRSNATKTVILMCDSKITDKNKTLTESDLLKKMGIKIVTVSLGSEADETELSQIASKERNLALKGMKNLEQYRGLISSEICEAIKGASKDCTNRQMELMIAMDSSSSIGPTNWRSQLNFVDRIVKDLDIAPRSTRMGMVIFNTNTSLKFGLSEYKDKYEVIAAINDLNFTEGMTAIGDALKMCQDELLNNSRRDVPKVVLVITDGIANIGLSPEIVSTDMKKYGIKIIAVGIGSSISEFQLKSLSSSGKFHSVLNFKSMADYDTYKIVKESCQAGEIDG